MNRFLTLVSAVAIAGTSAAAASFAQTNPGTTGVTSGIVGGLGQPSPAPPPPVRVGSGIRPPARVKDVRPVYPASAQAARVQGVVVLEVTIRADGTVGDAKVLRSIPLLDQAAIDAVKQWLYEPTLLNGVAVPVIVTVTVNFSLMDSTSLRITDRSGVVTIVTDPIVEYAVTIDPANPAMGTGKMRDGLRAFRGSAEINVTWSLVETIMFEGVVPERPSRLRGTISLKSGERTPVEFLIPAAGGMLRGKTGAGDYSIALKDVATISPTSVPSPAADGRNLAPPPNGAGIGSGTPNAGTPDAGSQRPDGTYVPGKSVTYPRVLRQVKPNYTAEAMKARIQGAVFIECVILPDGTVGNVRVVKSLDSTFGLDDEAIKAAKQWRFQPGARDGVPVPVLVTIELTFTLGKH